MVPLGSLLLPTLVSAVVVCFLSWLIHMVLKYHHGDFAKLANEDAVMNALRPLGVPPLDMPLTAHKLWQAITAAKKGH